METLVNREQMMNTQKILIHLIQVEVVLLVLHLNLFLELVVDQLVIEYCWVD